MKIKIKYFSKDYPKLERIAKGDFVYGVVWGE